MNNTEWGIRKANPKDIPFIYETWLKSYKHDSAIGKSTRSGIFFDEYKTIVDRILSNKDTQTLVACLNDSTDVILGYLVKELNLAHYCFVKESFRRLGVARSLFATDGMLIRATSTTHKTYYAQDLIDRFGLDFNPFLLYKTSQGESHE